MSEEIILIEEDNKGWFNPTPARWESFLGMIGGNGATGGDFILTKTSIIFKPRSGEETVIPIYKIGKVNTIKVRRRDTLEIEYYVGDDNSIRADTKAHFIVRNIGNWITEITERIKKEMTERRRTGEELKKESPFYVGDGSTGSEMKNACKRCNKIWYLDAEELMDLENRLETSTKLMGQMGGLNLVTVLFNPMLAAQNTTTMAANTGALKSLADELNEKSRCPECNSKNIERTLVDIDHYEQEEEKTVKRKGGSLADDIKELNELKEQGILDEEEFKSAKQKLIEKQ